MSVADALIGAVERATGDAVSAARPVRGGSINDAFALDLADGRRLFVKTRTNAAPGEYAVEAAGLAWLKAAGALRVPGVVALGDGEEQARGDAPPRFLALEWIDEGHLSVVGQEELGRGLAALHAAGAPAFGGDRDLRIGALSLPNEPLLDWPSFYAERRLRPLLGTVVERGALSHTGARAVERVCERLPELAGPAEAPARLHGDLWNGNVLPGADGYPWLIDPAAYGGHREIDLAMLDLFGAPGPRVLDAYREAAPLADGYEQRRELWTLFPLLVHAALFGGSYGAAVERVAQRYTG